MNSEYSQPRRDQIHVEIQEQESVQLLVRRLGCLESVHLSEKHDDQTPFPSRSGQALEDPQDIPSDQDSTPYLYPSEIKDAFVFEPGNHFYYHHNRNTSGR